MGGKKEQASKLGKLKQPLGSNILSFLNGHDLNKKGLESHFTSFDRHTFLLQESRVSDEYKKLLGIHNFDRKDLLSDNITKVFLKFHRAKECNDDNSKLSNLEDIIFADTKVSNNLDQGFYRIRRNDFLTKPIIDEVPQIIQKLPKDLQYEVVKKYLSYIEDPTQGKSRMLDNDDGLGQGSDPFGCRRRQIASDAYESFGRKKDKFLKDIEKKVLPYCSLPTLSKLRADLETASNGSVSNSFSMICQRRVNNYDYYDTEYKKTSSYDKAKTLIEDKIKAISNNDYSKIKKYESLANNESAVKNKVQNILQDYVNEGSGFLNRVFKNKHHTEAVREFLQTNQNTTDDKTYLDNLKNFRKELQELNSNGSLNRRMEFVFQNYSTGYESEKTKGILLAK
ncbi:DUF5617 domain-containing protein [Cysteiniphilum sp. 6C5]|uniref:DUF5617 domain-containing protein n=1 Tax=unclassified Cysteiniphilum TaxID=2610889 RepID=UPI003F840E2E